MSSIEEKNEINLFDELLESLKCDGSVDLKLYFFPSKEKS